MKKMKKKMKKFMPPKKAERAEGKEMPESMMTEMVEHQKQLARRSR